MRLLKKLSILKKDLAPCEQVLFNTPYGGTFNIKATIAYKYASQSLYIKLNNKTVRQYLAQNAFTNVDLIFTLKAGDIVSATSLQDFMGINVIALRV